ncbi:MAG: Golgi transport complex subunit 6 [Claussenomyces sp. TS43310]|nr:MAG: Golgi transport complex subunit 6 [Claussenomyces sp. TS43310]
MTSSDYVLVKRPSIPEAFEASPSSTSPSTSQSAFRPNALASKVTSVLAASYADLEIKDALNLLDRRGLENTAATRRQLRLDVQRDVIESNGAIVREFGQVAEQLKRIGLTITSLNQGFEQMRQHINAAHHETAPVLDEASDLMSQRNHVEAKQQLLRAFNAHFVMSDDDVAKLTSTAEPVNDEFFVVLGRAKKIQIDCEILLGTENQKLGHETLERTSKNIAGAFQKLYRWIQREFKSLNLENPQISSPIRRALRVLAERPSLFQNCLDSFAEARESILSDAFYTALTGSSATGKTDNFVKPMESVAHDPLRYVGDMLAWTHSATVSEREALEALFISDGGEIAKGIQAGRDNELWNRISEDEEASEFDGVKALNELVDRDVGGVAQILRQRIGQVIQSHEETIMAYKIANLLNFYSTTFSKLLGHDSELLRTFGSLEESALRQFRALMREHVAGLQSDVQQVPHDLGTPDFFQDGLKQLTDIMKTYDTSFTSTEGREEEFKPILIDAFDPYVQNIESMAKSLEAPSNAIFAINCILAARTVLSAVNFTSERVLVLEDSTNAYSMQLVEYQYAFFLQNSGVYPLLQALSTASIDSEDLSKIATLEAFHPQSLEDASHILDDFLPSALMDAMENLKHLQSSRLAREITEEAADKFCEDFEFVEERLVAADSITEHLPNGEDQREVGTLRALFPRTSGEIRVLLS